MKHRTLLASAIAACAVALPLAGIQAQQKDTKKADAQDPKPRLSLKAQPTMSIAPARIVFSAELAGGANDYQEYYCPSVEWEWGDETRSESTLDCEPYEAG